MLDLIPQDYAAWANATGNPFPATGEEKAQVQGQVRAFKQQREQGGMSPLGTAAVAGAGTLAAAGLAGAGYMNRNRIGNALQGVKSRLGFRNQPAADAAPVSTNVPQNSAAVSQQAPQPYITTTEQATANAVRASAQPNTIASTGGSNSLDAAISAPAQANPQRANPISRQQTDLGRTSTPQQAGPVDFVQSADVARGRELRAQQPFNQRELALLSEANIPGILEGVQPGQGEKAQALLQQFVRSPEGMEAASMIEQGRDYRKRSAFEGTEAMPVLDPGLRSYTTPGIESTLVKPDGTISVVNRIDNTEGGILRSIPTEATREDIIAAGFRDPAKEYAQRVVAGQIKNPGEIDVGGKRYTRLVEDPSTGQVQTEPYTWYTKEGFAREGTGDVTEVLYDDPRTGRLTGGANNPTKLRGPFGKTAQTGMGKGVIANIGGRPTVVYEGAEYIPDFVLDPAEQMQTKVSKSERRAGKTRGSFSVSPKWRGDLGTYIPGLPTDAKYNPATGKDDLPQTLYKDGKDALGRVGRKYGGQIHEGDVAAAVRKSAANHILNSYEFVPRGAEMDREVAKVSAEIAANPQAMNKVVESIEQSRGIAYIEQKEKAIMGLPISKEAKARALTNFRNDLGPTLQLAGQSPDWQPMIGTNLQNQMYSAAGKRSQGYGKPVKTITLDSPLVAKAGAIFRDRDYDPTITEAQYRHTGKKSGRQRSGVKIQLSPQEQLALARSQGYVTDVPLGAQTSEYSTAPGAISPEMASKYAFQMTPQERAAAQAAGLEPVEFDPRIGPVETSRGMEGALSGRVRTGKGLTSQAKTPYSFRQGEVGGAVIDQMGVDPATDQMIAADIRNREYDRRMQSYEASRDPAMDALIARVKAGQSPKAEAVRQGIIDDRSRQMREYRAGRGMHPDVAAQNRMVNPSDSATNRPSPTPIIDRRVQAANAPQMSTEERLIGLANQVRGSSANQPGMGAMEPTMASLGGTGSVRYTAPQGTPQSDFPGQRPGRQLDPVYMSRAEAAAYEADLAARRARARAR